MLSALRGYFAGPAREDVVAALVVTILLVPQCLAYALLATPNRCRPPAAAPGPAHGRSGAGDRRLPRRSNCADSLGAPGVLGAKHAPCGAGQRLSIFCSASQAADFVPIASPSTIARRKCMPPAIRAIVTSAMKASMSA